MASVTQEQLLEVIADIMGEQPDMRFGQLVASLALFAKGPIKAATWEVEDNELLTAAKRHLENLRERSQVAVQAKQDLSKMRQKAAV